MFRRRRRVTRGRRGFSRGRRRGFSRGRRSGRRSLRARIGIRM